MKLFFVAFISASPSFAAVSLGNFQGLAFSSATSRHAVEIRGGTLVNCHNSRITFTDCDVQDGSLVVSGQSENALRVAFTKVKILRDDGTPASSHYYYKGEADLVIGAKALVIPVSLTLNLDDGQPDRLFGSFELPDQFARTSLEAYRVTE